jgi:hypothetical protein
VNGLHESAGNAIRPLNYRPSVDPDDRPSEAGGARTGTTVRSRSASRRQLMFFFPDLPRKITFVS